MEQHSSTNLLERILDDHHCLFPSIVNAGDRIVRVGVYENAPKIFTLESGRPAGIFIDILENIAEKEGWELQYTSCSWAKCLELLRKGEIDLMPDVAYTGERDRDLSFHKTPVLSSWFQVYAHKGSGIRSILDLNQKRIAVLEGSVQQTSFSALAKSFGIRFTLIPKKDFNQVFKAVAAKEADAAVTNQFFGSMNSGKYGLEDTAVIFNPSDLFFAAPKHGDEDLLNRIDARLVELKNNSQSVYYKSLKHWISEEVRLNTPLWLQILALITILGFLISIAEALYFKNQLNARTRDLRQSELKFRTLFETANDSIFLMDNEKFIDCNKQTLVMFDCAYDEIIGQPPYQFSPPTQPDGRESAEKAMEKIKLAMKGKNQFFEWKHCRLDKTTFDAEVSLNRIDLGGNVFLQAIVRDITQRKKAHEQVHKLNEDLRKQTEILEQRVAERTAELVVAKERAESADRVKSAFLASMSHELRTPLNSIIGFTGIMLQELAGPLSQEQKKQLSMVQNSSRHLLNLINDVLDISKIEAGQLSLSISTFKIQTSIDKMTELVMPMAKKKGLDLFVDIAEDIGTATTDQRRLEQIILNLLTNALKFTERGHVRLQCRLKHNEILLTVSDTGIGISPEELPSLFQPFHQIDTGLARKHEGTGLGLSICKKLIEMMGGKINVESKLGKGSSFSVLFPQKLGDPS